MFVDPGRELGISIRGGVENGLGIYVSGVAHGTVAEASGIQVMLRTSEQYNFH